MIPLYGFLAGDTLGLLVLAQPDESMAALASQLERSARIRVASGRRLVVVFNGRALEPGTTVSQAGMQPLDRIDVVEAP